MLALLRWTLMFAAIMVVMQSTHAWTIGAKGRVSGPVIHTTYFVTPNNTSVPVHALGYVGTYLNGTCQIANATPYDLGTDNLRTGDFEDIDAFLLKSIIGGEGNCMTIFYTYKQIVMESFVMTWDGFNYTATIPAVASPEIQIM